MPANAKTPTIDQKADVSVSDGATEETAHLEAVPEPEDLESLDATDNVLLAPDPDPDARDDHGATDDHGPTDDPRSLPEATAGAVVAEPVSSPPPPGGRGTRTVGRWLLRGLLVAAVVVAGFALWPEFRDRVLDPVEANAADTAAVSDRVDAAEAQVARLEAEALELRNRIASLESGAATLGADLDATSGRVDDLVPVIEGHTEALELLDAQQAALAGRVDADSVEAAIGIDVVRSMELMSRARLFLYQSNYGLAAEDVRAAHAVLERITEQADAPDVFALALERLDRVLENLPDRPVLASDDLDVAWQILLAESRVSALQLSSPTDTSTAGGDTAGQAETEDADNAVESDNAAESEDGTDQ